jgi:hypothetical protein
MQVFRNHDGFLTGAWAHGLSWVLAPKRHVPGWHPRIQSGALAGHNQRWIQYEPLIWPEDFASSGRPILRAGATIRGEQALFVGYSVQSVQRRSRVPSHWRTLEVQLQDEPFVELFEQLLAKTPNGRRAVWMFGGLKDQLLLQLPDTGPSQLYAIRTHLTEWGQESSGTALIGSMYPESTCRAMTNQDAIRDFGADIVRAVELLKLIDTAGSHA